MATPGAFGKPAHKRPVERPTWEWIAPDGNTIISYYDGGKTNAKTYTYGNVCPMRTLRAGNGNRRGLPRPTADASCTPRTKAMT